LEDSELFFFVQRFSRILTQALPVSMRRNIPFWSTSGQTDGCQRGKKGSSSEDAEFSKKVGGRMNYYYKTTLY
jgi:hypothetical protein